ncbi:MAG: amino acid ABC transporter ATP-binding protein [Candidatus Taylorbacteria bacterium]|nr:amino acid ABC transporter ATP-binding protein [Candidatus Taylorbacteria bacterium]
MLQASNITKKYGNRVVLDNISLDIKPGTITSIIGPSGSGKTTLLKALSLLDLPQTGNITHGDTQYAFPLISQNITPPWPKVSVVFQQLFIWPHLTLRKNIELPLEIKGLLDSNKEYLEELYMMFGMKEFLNRFPNEVSLGQRQRVALVRALALKPEYLLLDEITSSLDVEQSEIILSHLCTIKRKGVGILMVAHDVNFAISNADTVCFMEGGKIIKKGKPYEFLLESKNKRISDFIANASLGASNVKIYSGEEEFQAYHLALLNRLPENSTITIIGGLGDTWYAPMKEKYKEYDALRVKKNIVWNMLMYEYGEKDKKLIIEHPSIDNLSILSANTKNMANININSDGTVILQIFDPIPTVIEIRNQALADSYMRYYNDLAKHSKKFVG